MTKEISALLDGELEAHEAPALWSQLRSDRRLFDTWRDYQLIRDAMRQEDGLGADIVARVMRDLETEPVVFAPQQKVRQKKTPQSAMLALAASVAGVAVVGWLALAPQPGQREVPAMARTVVPTVPMTQVSPQPAASLASTQNPHGASEYREYLLAHQANASGLHMQGGAQHIRTVSAIGAGQ